MMSYWYRCLRCDWEFEWRPWEQSGEPKCPECGSYEVLPEPDA